MSVAQTVKGFVRSRRQVVVVLGVFAVGLLAGRCDYGRRGGSTPSHQSHDDEAAAGTYTCAMHPEVRAKEPGACPICGMDMVPLDQTSTTVSGGRISLSARSQALARIRTTRVVAGSSQGGALRLVGRVDYDETRVRSLTSWISGRIERLAVSTTGERVRRGQVIAVIYSPEVYAAQSDLIQARKQLDRLANSTPGSRAAAKAGQNAARERLRLLGVSAAELKKMEAAESPWRRVSIRAQSAGTILRRRVDTGTYVEPGSELFQVADLRTVWVQIDAYESDLPRLRKGQPVTLTSRSLPGKTFVGTIAFIDPVVKTQSRTARVRVEVANADGTLKPGMFADASIDTGADSSSLVVPASAVLFTGQRSIVYVEIEDTDRPTYELREVEVGPRNGATIPIVSGLREGERVVTRGAFALDADLQLRGGRSMMSTAGDSTRIAWSEIPSPLRKHLEIVVAAYLDCADALAADDFGKAKVAAQRIVDAGHHAGDGARAQAAWAELETRWLPEAKAIAGAKDIKEARARFQNLSATAAATVRTLGNPLGETIRVATCPMVFDGSGGTWLQRQPTVNNAYAGAEMLTCGTIESEIPSTDASKPPPAPADHQHGGH